MSYGWNAKFSKPSPDTDFVLNKEGSSYVAWGGRKYSRISNTDLSDTWADMNAAVSAGPSVKFGSAEFTIDACLDVENEGTIISGVAPGSTIFKLGSGVDDDIIRNSAGGFYRNTFIEKLTIDGNRVNNTIGRGIEWNVTAGTSGSEKFYENLSIDKIIITECDNEGLYFRTTTGVLGTLNLGQHRIWNNDGTTAAGHQVYLERVFDSFIGGVKSMMSSLHMNNCATNIIRGIYFGGGIDNLVKLDGGASDYATTGNIISGCKVDNASGTAIQFDDYARRNKVVGCDITNQAQGHGDNTAPAIEVVSATALYNQIEDTHIGHNNIITTNRWNYAFQELQDSYTKILNCSTGYGAVLGGNAEHFGTLEADLVAASHTEIQNCRRDDGRIWRQS